MRYRKKRKNDTAERELLRALAAERRRFGYRRLREMAKRKGRHMNLKKVYRLYREEGLAVRRRRGRRARDRRAGAVAPGAAANEILGARLHVGRAGDGPTLPGVQRRGSTREGLAAEVDT